MSSLPIRIVLVETSHPGNIGGVARAMKNMTLEQLYLVAPRHFPHADATARSSGADDILASARVCHSLQQALEGCSMVFGASARRRTISWPLVDARECAQLALEMSGSGEVAVVFGREHSGLTNEELEQCNYLVHIPSNRDYSSLNIAAAVQVITYEIMMASGGGALERAPKLAESELPATADDIERFYEHLEQSLEEVEFLDPDNPRQLMRRLRRLYNRVGLSRNELNILRGILTAVQKKVKRES